MSPSRNAATDALSPPVAPLCRRRPPRADSFLTGSGLPLCSEVDGCVIEAVERSEEKKR